MKIGIDLGGSHIAIGVVDNNNELIEKVEKAVKNIPENADKKQILEVILRVFAKK